MPFTFAHPAAVLPLLRRCGLVPAALIIGAMVPDAEYFLYLRATRTISHTPLGVLLVCLPVGLALWVVWEGLWRAHALALWPGLARVLPGPGSLRSPLPRVALSIVLGAFTHLLWDAGTHEHGALVERLPGLRATAFELPGDSVAWYRVLQHGSTLFGLALLTADATRRWRRAGPNAALGPPDTVALLGLASVAAAAACTALAWAPKPHTRGHLVHALLAGISAALAGFTLQALWRRRFPRA